MLEVGMEMDIIKRGRTPGSHPEVLVGGDAEFAAVPRQGETVIIPQLGLCTKVAKVSYFCDSGRPYLVLQPHYADDVDETVSQLEELGWVQV